MVIKSFEDIVAWQKAKILTVDVYRLSKDMKDYGFKDQIQRASVSIMNNIAEGFERQSNNDFRKFLFISKGSCGEVRSLVILGKELGYFETLQADQTNNQALEITKIISGLIKKL